jgi:hypothetical protein
MVWVVDAVVVVAADDPVSIGKTRSLRSASMSGLFTLQHGGALRAVRCSVKKVRGWRTGQGRVQSCCTGQSGSTTTVVVATPALGLSLASLGLCLPYGRAGDNSDRRK